VQSNKERDFMQSTSILAAAVAIACVLPGWTAIAADAPMPSGVVAAQDGRTTSETFILQAKIEEISEAKTEEKTEVKTEEAPEGDSEEKQMTRTQTSDTDVSVRNTRPRTDPHGDARACLNAGNNQAIIRCTEKYR
jgi:hypothetical protein